MKRKVIVILAFVLGFLLLIYGILWHNSFELALLSAGCSPDEVTVIQKGAGIDGEYCVIVEDRLDKPSRPVYLQRGFAGWWTYGQFKAVEHDQLPMTGLFWSMPAGFRQYSAYDYDGEKEIVLWECHVVYCGSDAVRYIEIPTEKLPENTTLNITQLGNSYIMHFITFQSNSIPSFEEAHAMIEEFCAAQ